MTDDVSMYSSEPIPADVLAERRHLMQLGRDLMFVQTYCPPPTFAGSRFQYITTCMDVSARIYPFDTERTARASEAASYLYDLMLEQQEQAA